MREMNAAEMDVAEVIENCGPVEATALTVLWPHLFALLLERLDTLNDRLEEIQR